MKGVVAFITENTDGSVRLVLDDVTATSSEAQGSWSHSAVFTSSSYDAKSFKGLSLSERQFAQIGENIVARLIVLTTSS